MHVHRELNKQNTLLSVRTTKFIPTSSRLKTTPTDLCWNLSPSIRKYHHHHISLARLRYPLPSTPRPPAQPLPTTLRVTWRVQRHDLLVDACFFPAFIFQVSAPLMLIWNTSWSWVGQNHSKERSCDLRALTLWAWWPRWHSGYRQPLEYSGCQRWQFS